jgi:hypothetical protein
MTSRCRSSSGVLRSPTGRRWSRHHWRRRAMRSARPGAQWIALVIDEGLPDGSGLDALEFARRRGINAPAALYSGKLSPPVLLRASRMDLRSIPKERGGSEELQRFLATAALEAKAGTDPVENELQTWRKEYGVTSRPTSCARGAGESHIRCRPDRSRARPLRAPRDGVARLLRRAHARRERHRRHALLLGRQARPTDSSDEPGGRGLATSRCGCRSSAKTAQARSANPHASRDSRTSSAC